MASRSPNIEMAREVSTGGAGPLDIRNSIWGYGATVLSVDVGFRNGVWIDRPVELLFAAVVGGMRRWIVVPTQQDKNNVERYRRAWLPGVSVGARKSGLWRS